MIGGIYGYLIAGLLVVAAITGYTWKVHNHGYHSRDKEVAQLIADRDNALAANSANLKTLDALKAANEELAAERTADQEQAKQDVLAQQARADKLNEQLRASRSQREKVYDSNPTARIWADDLVPAAVLAGLRLSAAGTDGGGRGEGAGVRQAGPDAHAGGGDTVSTSRWLEEQGLRGLVGRDPFGLEGGEQAAPQDRRSAAEVIL